MQKLQKPEDPGFLPTLPNLLAHATTNFPDRTFLTDDNGPQTFAQVNAQSAELARGLLAMGVSKASRVALLIPNTPDWVICWLAAGRIGALTQPFSTLYKPAEIAWGLAHLDTETLLVQSRYLNIDFLARLEEAIPGLADQTSTELFLPSHPYMRHIIVLGECDRPWAIKGAGALGAAAQDHPQIDDAYLARVEQMVVPADLLVTISTSGTTAHPKAVVHTHGTAVRITHAFLNYIDFLPEDRNLVGMPMFWVGGLNTNLLPALHMGASLIFASGPKTSDMIEAIERHRVTRLPWWPIQIQGLVKEATERGADLSSMDRALHTRDERGQDIPAARRGGSFGMTETFGMHTIERRTAPIPANKAGSLGRNLPHVERRIVDPETGRELPPGVQGELQVRGYTLMAGYYKVEREDVFTADGFYPTGDICSIDEDGYLYFHTRRTDMIKTSGANVAPMEVERVLSSDPGVAEAYVFGMPHPTKGEAVVAVIVPEKNARIDTSALRKLTEDQLSSYKIPQAIFPMDAQAIPRTASAKVNKVQLAKLIEDQIDW